MLTEPDGQKYNWWTTDRYMDVQRETIILHNYRVAGYKKDGIDKEKASTPGIALVEAKSQGSTIHKFQQESTPPCHPPENLW